MNECDSCSFYVYDEDYDDYMCQVNMDEDDVVRLMTDANMNVLITVTMMNIES